MERKKIIKPRERMIEYAQKMQDVPFEVNITKDNQRLGMISEKHLATARMKEKDDIQSQIVNVLIKYKSSIDSSKKLAAFLADCFPEERAIRNVLVSSYSEGIVEEIRNTKEITFLKERFVKKLTCNYAFNEQISSWVFDVWANYCAEVKKTEIIEK